ESLPGVSVRGSFEPDPVTQAGEVVDAFLQNLDDLISSDRNAGSGDDDTRRLGEPVLVACDGRVYGGIDQAGRKVRPKIIANDEHALRVNSHGESRWSVCTG